MLSVPRTVSHGQAQHRAENFRIAKDSALDQNFLVIVQHVVRLAGEVVQVTAVAANGPHSNGQIGRRLASMKDGDLMAGLAQMPNHVAANETRATDYQDSHRRLAPEEGSTKQYRKNCRFAFLEY